MFILMDARNHDLTNSYSFSQVKWLVWYTTLFLKSLPQDDPFFFSRGLLRHEVDRPGAGCIA
jgi:hypothetical protein